MFETVQPAKEAKAEILAASAQILGFAMLQRTNCGKA